MENYKLKFIHLSDLHITKHRNLLKPMIEYINKDVVDFVVVTGDLVHEQDKESFKIAEQYLNEIVHRVLVIPGDYDGGLLWKEYFGNSYRSLKINDYCIDLLDTSFMKHRFAVGWCDVLKESPEQYEWLVNELKNEKYHLIFSHHPAKVLVNSNNAVCNDGLLKDNVRANYCGHLRDPIRLHFKYNKPIKQFEYGFISTTMKFHGNSCYSLVLIKENDEIVNVPRIIEIKRITE